ncbi:MAG: hypothetical protein IJY92_03280 [Alphaproteobacteria bacterium]|nr:hypothetical protein [Alphaproteobacteria bacterium]
MKKLFIKILPFWVAFASGILLYIVTDKFVSDVGLNNLLINVAAGLVSIPLVFIFYDVINKITSQKLHNSLFESVTIEINSQLIDLIKELAALMDEKEPENMESLEDFLSLEQSDILKSLKLGKVDIKKLEAIKQELVLEIHKPTSFDILSEKQISSILNIVKEITFLIKNIDQSNTVKETTKHKKIIALNVEYIFINLTTWIESGTKDAFHNHGRFSLTRKNA